MKMTIEEIKKEIRSDWTIKRITGNDYTESIKDCLAQLLVIAEKYQKIEQIIKNWENNGEEDDPINIIDSIEEVLEEQISES